MLLTLVSTSFLTDQCSLTAASTDILNCCIAAGLILAVSLQGVTKCAEEYHSQYVVELEQLKKEKADREERRQQVRLGEGYLGRWSKRVEAMLPVMAPQRCFQPQIHAPLGCSVLF